LSLRGSLPKKGNVVELAMGNGANLRNLVVEGKFTRAIGFDYSFGMVRAAKSRNGNGHPFYAIADAHHIPIKGGSSDLTLMFNALDRLRDPDRTLCEIRRIAKDGGIIVLGQCMPFQYDIKIGSKTISCLEPGKRIHSLEDAVARIPGAKITQEERGLAWHPITVTQGREDLKVDIVVAKLD
jgi:ubiquinone/menaquinone biosynthesis C-methylase UbiE